MVQYTYDDLGRVILETYEDGSTVAYAYDNTGALATVTDSETGIKTTYYYDFTDRLMKYVEKGTNYSHSVGYEYDTLNNLTHLVETINGVKHTTEYTYDEDNRLTHLLKDDVHVDYDYDLFGRIETVESYAFSGSSGYVDRYYYYTPFGSGTTNQITSIWADSPTASVFFDFGYDNNGNLTTVEYGSYDIEYFYDSANQLIRENNNMAGKTWTWEYDDAGNIPTENAIAFIWT